MADSSWMTIPMLQKKVSKVIRQRDSLCSIEEIYRIIVQVKDYTGR